MSWNIIHVNFKSIEKLFLKSLSIGVDDKAHLWSVGEASSWDKKSTQRFIQVIVSLRRYHGWGHNKQSLQSVELRTLPPILAYWCVDYFASLPTWLTSPLHVQ